MSTTFDKILDHFDLVGNFRAAQNRDARARRICRRHRQVLQFLIHQKPGGGLLDETDHADGRRVRAMRGTERVVHIDVAKLRELLRKAGIVGLFFRVIAQVFQQQHFARLGQHGFHCRPDAIRREFHRLAEKLLPELRGHRLHAHLRIRLAFGAAEVRREDHARAVLQRVIDGRQRRANALVAGDFLPAVGQRNIEIHANEDAFPVQIEVFDRQFCHLKFELSKTAGHGNQK